MASQNRDHLLTPSNGGTKFAIPKNLIWVIMGILIVAVVLVIVTQVIFADKPAPTKVLQKPTADTNQAPAPEAIDAIAKGQTAAATKEKQDELARVEAESRRTQASSASPAGLPGAPVSSAPSPLPPAASFPEIDKAGKINLPRPAAAPSQTDPQFDLAAREMNIRSAPILAISDGSVERLAQGLTGQAKGNPSISELEKQRADAQAGAQDQINRLMAVGSQTAQGTAGKGKLEADWLKEAAQVKKSHEPLRGYYPTSRFVLMQGGVINAVLMNALNTDLPGEVRARTTMDVYDSVGGNTLLIPKGSVLVGRYNSDVRVGQSRINTAFQRLILPNGLAVDLQGNIGQDQSGSAGLPGDVNNHYGQMFFVSVLTAIGAQIAARSEPANTGTTINTGSAGGTTNPAGQIFSDINRAVIERNRTTAATITIPAGTPFTINVANDVELPPYGRR